MNRKEELCNAYRAGVRSALRAVETAARVTQEATIDRQPGAYRVGAAPEKIARNAVLVAMEHGRDTRAIAMGYAVGADVVEQVIAERTDSAGRPAGKGGVRAMCARINVILDSIEADAKQGKPANLADIETVRKLLALVRDRLDDLARRREGSDQVANVRASRARRRDAAKGGKRRRVKPLKALFQPARTLIRAVGKTAENIAENRSDKRKRIARRRRAARQ